MRYSLKRAKIKRIRAQDKKRKPKDYNPSPLQSIAMDSIRFEGRNHYVLTAIDLNTRVAYAKPLPTKHTKHTAKALLEVIESVESLRAKALSSSHNSKIPITILSDNGSEFHKEFEALIKEKRLEHLWTYPNAYSLK